MALGLVTLPDSVYLIIYIFGACVLVCLVHGSEPASASIGRPNLFSMQHKNVPNVSDLLQICKFVAAPAPHLYTPQPWAGPSAPEH